MQVEIRGGNSPAPQVTLYTHVGPYVGTYTTWSLAPATTTYTNSGGGGGTVPYVGSGTNPNVPWYPGGYPVGGTGGYGGGYTAPIIPPHVPSLVPTSTPPSVPWHKPTYNNTPSGANPITNKIPDALSHPGRFIGKQADPQIALAANREAFGQPANMAQLPPEALAGSTNLWIPPRPVRHQPRKSCLAPLAHLQETAPKAGE